MRRILTATIFLLLLTPLFPLFLLQIAHATPDPSAVGTTSFEAAFDNRRSPNSDRCFYTQGRFWVFYCDGSNIGWRSSIDAETWSAFTVVKATNTNWDVTFDGTYVHITYYYPSGVYGSPLYYRRGTPNPDGTITWLPEQTVLPATTNVVYEYPTITVDSEGYPWIGYQYRTTATGSANPRITTSSTNDGTWSTRSGFPYSLTSLTGYRFPVLPIPLTQRKIYAVYHCFTTYTLRGRLWGGSSWGSEEDSGRYVHDVSGVAIDDEAHIAALEAASYDILHLKRDDTGWSIATIQLATGSSDYHPMLTYLPAVSGLVCFWMESPTADHVFYKIYSGGAWGDLVDWIDESTDQITAPYCLAGFYRSYESKIGLAYLTGVLGSPRTPLNSTISSLDRLR